MNRLTPVNRDLRLVSFRYLGRIRNEMHKAKNAKTHSARGTALDQATEFLERVYKKAEAQE